ncbi:PAQR family membrane homeostasis protein TrhA [Actinomycetospora sp. CA-084318]|uniref:PAQR family membrane homeostasis protein TrhA n=1 Tax=Actinomycetospora sp. CA-084318 TaxID=3239892 RepID=UPI003D98D64E
MTIVDSAPATPVKPRLRGWLHLWSFAVGIAAGATLIALAGSTVSGEAAAAVAVYSATVLGVFGISALYHRRSWVSPRARTTMKRLDHAMIFIFIAGTYTPFAVLALPETTGLIVLAVVWTGAVAGAALKVLRPHTTRWVGVPIYLALGWVAVFVLPDLLARGGVAAFVLLVVGGAIYTLGAVGFALRRPHGWPATFGYHEFFHAATVVAAICHHIAIWLILYA